MIALVFEEIRLARSLGSILKVNGSISAKTTFAPQYKTTFAVETQVNAGTMTSSPGPTSKATRAKCKAVVALVTAKRV